jgi:hypothetical protein
VTVEVTANVDATEVDVDGLVDETVGVRYLGRATRGFDGRWTCLAAVGGALCRVEVTVRPTVHVGGDPGDEDDRAARGARLSRDLG